MNSKTSNQKQQKQTIDTDLVDGYSSDVEVLVAHFKMTYGGVEIYPPTQLQEILTMTEKLHLISTKIIQTLLFCGGPSGLFDTVNKKYPEIWAIYKQMKALDWDENETSFAPCMADFEKCDKSTYDMMIKTLAWQWEGDSAASRLAAIVAPLFHRLSCGQRGSEFQTMNVLPRPRCSYFRGLEID